MIHSMHRSVIAKKGVTYSYLGHPVDANGEGEGATGSVVNTGSTYGAWRIYVNKISSSDHSGGTAVAMGAYFNRTPSATICYLCLYNESQELMGYVEVDSFPTDDWKDSVDLDDLTEYTTGSLEFDGDEDLYIGMAVYIPTQTLYIAQDDGATGDVYYDLITGDQGDNPPASAEFIATSWDSLMFYLKYQG